jgi:hypothetical protein
VASSGISPSSSKRTSGISMSCCSPKPC